tara:strand:- start:39 stop:1097 length:1059 start_codon:yes stop_codon:yes gene_type:complete
MANGIIDTLKNYYNVATGSGLHEQAMKEYLDPFTGEQTYQISKGPVAEYMSNYLKDYTKPDNKAAQALSEGRGPGQMRVVGLGESPNPFSASGIAKAAEMAENPSFQAENLFGEGTLTKVPGGYDYTGGKFDFATDNPVTNFLQDKVFKPSEYVMKFDENFKPLETFNRDFRNFDKARMGITETLPPDAVLNIDELDDDRSTLLDRKDGILNNVDFGKLLSLAEILGPTNLRQAIAGTRLGNTVSNFFQGFQGSRDRPDFQYRTPGYTGQLIASDQYNPKTGLNRFDRAKTLFGQSRTLKEYFEKKKAEREAKAAKAASPSGSTYSGPSGYEDMSDAASDLEMSQGGRGSRR